MSVLKRLPWEYWINEISYDDIDFIMDKTSCGTIPFIATTSSGNTAWMVVRGSVGRDGKVYMGMVTIGPRMTHRRVISSISFNGTEYPVKGDMFL
jgi:hypothetical protein